MKLLIKSFAMTLLLSLIISSVEAESKISLNQMMEEISQKFDVKCGMEIYCDDQVTEEQILKQTIDASILEKDSISVILKSLESIKAIPFKFIANSNKNKKVIFAIHDSLFENDSYVLNMKFRDFSFSGTKDELIDALRDKGVKLAIGFIYIYPPNSEAINNEALVYSMSLKNCTVRDIVSCILASNETRSSLHVCAYKSLEEETLVML